MKETSCEDLSTYFLDHVNGELPPAEAAEVRRHLASCAACRAEVESLGGVWHALGRLADEEPSAALRSRFYALLEAYQEGLAHRERLGDRFAAWLAGWWPRRPTRQLALTAAALVVGLVAGARLDRAVPGGEIAVLRDEVASLNRRVSLSLLRQDSATARLQGVSYSRRAPADDELVTALLETVDGDDNVNVRLAAVDALARFAHRPPVIEALRRSLLRQESPLVQLAMVDLLLEIDGAETTKVIRQLYAREGLDDTVRRHIAERLGAHA